MRLIASVLFILLSLTGCITEKPVPENEEWEISPLFGWNNTPTKVDMSHDYISTTANIFGIYNEEGSNMGRAHLYCKPFTSTISSADAGLNNLWFYNYSDRIAKRVCRLILLCMKSDTLSVWDTQQLLQQ
ncbi:hypothetical protein QFZ78_003296 [Paenibacillus sp. V4I5]|nr:hypothetical protein [Paenibacillus sp. V4I5]